MVEVFRDGSRVCLVSGCCRGPASVVLQLGFVLAGFYLLLVICPVTD